jgi:small subunit ribosomal protein S13
MPRLIGVDIPNNKKLPYALSYIYGVGPCRVDLIVEQTDLNLDMRAQDLTEENIDRITAVSIESGWKVEGDLRREIASNLKRLQAIKCDRGVCHDRGLPVLGQRTSTNARTRNGARKTIGVMKKKICK